MQRPSLEEFIDIFTRSGLLDDSIWQRWSAENAPRFASSQEMAESLVKEGLITPWQRDKLLEGKTKVFFLGRYKILGQLGAGAMGAVYLAEHVVMRHRVAIKVMASRLQGSTRHVERFQREARATAAVNHPRIVRAFDVEMSGETPYLVMEYVEGDDLQKVVHRGGVLPIDEAAEYIRQTAEGLHAAHQAGLVHRDVKPSNILVDKAGQIRILDLGLARLEAGEEASLTMMHNSRALGTVDYLAPEQARDSHGVDARADIYSLGCTLYFLLTGHPPFDEGTISQRLLAHQTKEVPNVRELRPEVPADLATICHKMLVKERSRRFQSAADVAAALQAFLRGEPPLALSGEDELLRIELDANEVPPPKKTPAPEAPRRAVARAVAAAASRSSGSSSPGSGISLPPIHRPDPFGEGLLSSGSGPLLAGSTVVPLVAPALSPLDQSSALLGPIGPGELQPIPPAAPAGMETVSDLMGTTQSFQRQKLAAAQALPAEPNQEASGNGSIWQSIVQAVSERAEEGEGIGGLAYKLWFLIIFGVVSGLVLAGVGYSVLRTIQPQPETPQKQAFEK